MRRRIPDDETLAREYLANERTLLAWVRTGATAIGLGILLDTITRTLDALATLPPELRGNGMLLFSLCLVAFGSSIIVVAGARFVQYRRELRRGMLTSAAAATVLVVFGLVILSIAYATYLVITGGV